MSKARPPDRFLMCAAQVADNPFGENRPNLREGIG
jgi:hypothetical protein